ncbi:MAG: FG-GAP-like repeat-containing protein [Bacteroidota bacterium]
MICLNGEDGSKKWEKIIDPNASIQTSPALLDVDGDGQLDFVVANWSYTNTNCIWAFRGDTRTQIWVSTVPTDVIYHGASFGDIDGDGKPELAFGCYDHHLYLLNAEDGSLKWSFDYGPYNYVGSPVVMADINNDNKYELIAAGWYKMKAVSDTGTEIWNYNIPDYASCFRGVAISDINDDGYLEPVFGTSEGKVIALDGYSGGELWRLDLAADYGDTLDIDHAPLIGDFDGDGKLEGFVVGGHTRYPNIANDYGRAYAFSLGNGTHPSWKMFQHDIVRISRVPMEWYLPASGQKRDEIVVDANPNPFNDQIRIRVEMKKPDKIHLKITETTGRLIRSEQWTQDHSDAVYTLDGFQSLAPGLYFLTVESEGFRVTKRMIRP